MYLGACCGQPVIAVFILFFQTASLTEAAVKLAVASAAHGRKHTLAQAVGIAPGAVAAVLMLGAAVHTDLIQALQARAALARLCA